MDLSSFYLIISYLYYLLTFIDYLQGEIHFMEKKHVKNSRYIIMQKNILNQQLSKALLTLQNMKIFSWLK